MNYHPLIHITAQYFGISVRSMMNKTGHTFSTPRNIAGTLMVKCGIDYREIANQFSRAKSFSDAAVRACRLLESDPVAVRDIENIWRIYLGKPQLERFSKVRHSDDEVECECGEWFKPKGTYKSGKHEGCPKCKAMFDRVEPVNKPTNQRKCYYDAFRVHLPTIGISGLKFT